MVYTSKDWLVKVPSKTELGKKTDESEKAIEAAKNSVKGEEKKDDKSWRESLVDTSKDVFYWLSNKVNTWISNIDKDYDIQEAASLREAELELKKINPNELNDDWKKLYNEQLDLLSSWWKSLSPKKLDIAEVTKAADDYLNSWTYKNLKDRQEKNKDKWTTYKDQIYNSLVSSFYQDVYNWTDKKDRVIENAEWWFYVYPASDSWKFADRSVWMLMERSAWYVIDWIAKLEDRARSWRNIDINLLQDLRNQYINLRDFAIYMTNHTDKMNDFWQVLLDYMAETNKDNPLVTKIHLWKWVDWEDINTYMNTDLYISQQLLADDVNDAFHWTNWWNVWKILPLWLNAITSIAEQTLEVTQAAWRADLDKSNLYEDTWFRKSFNVFDNEVYNSYLSAFDWNKNAWVWAWQWFADTAPDIVSILPSFAKLFSWTWRVWDWLTNATVLRKANNIVNWFKKWDNIVDAVAQIESMSANWLKAQAALKFLIKDWIIDNTIANWILQWNSYREYTEEDFVLDVASSIVFDWMLTNLLSKSAWNVLKWYQSKFRQELWKKMSWLTDYERAAASNQEKENLGNSMLAVLKDIKDTDPRYNKIIKSLAEYSSKAYQTIEKSVWDIKKNAREYANNMNNWIKNWPWFSKRSKFIDEDWNFVKWISDINMLRILADYNDYQIKTLDRAMADKWWFTWAIKEAYKSAKQDWTIIDWILAWYEAFKSMSKKDKQLAMKAQSMFVNKYDEWFFEVWKKRNNIPEAKNVNELYKQLIKFRKDLLLHKKQIHAQALRRAEYIASYKKKLDEKWLYNATRYWRRWIAWSIDRILWEWATAPEMWWLLFDEYNDALLAYKDLSYNWKWFFEFLKWLRNNEWFTSRYAEEELDLALVQKSDVKADRTSWWIHVNDNNNLVVWIKSWWLHMRFNNPFEILYFIWERWKLRVWDYDIEYVYNWYERWEVSWNVIIDWEIKKWFSINSDGYLEYYDDLATYAGNIKNTPDRVDWIFIPEEWSSVEQTTNFWEDIFDDWRKHPEVDEYDKPTIKYKWETIWEEEVENFKDWTYEEELERVPILRWIPKRAYNKLREWDEYRWAWPEWVPNELKKQKLLDMIRYYKDQPHTYIDEQWNRTIFVMDWVTPETMTKVDSEYFVPDAIWDDWYVIIDWLVKLTDDWWIKKEKRVFSFKKMPEWFSRWIFDKNNKKVFELQREEYNWVKYFRLIDENRKYVSWELSFYRWQSVDEAPEILDRSLDFNTRKDIFDYLSFWWLMKAFTDVWWTLLYSISDNLSAFDLLDWLTIRSLDELYESLPKIRNIVKEWYKTKIYQEYMKLYFPPEMFWPEMDDVRWDICEKYLAQTYDLEEAYNYIKKTYWEDWDREVMFAWYVLEKDYQMSPTYIRQKDVPLDEVKTEAPKSNAPQKVPAVKELEQETKVVEDTPSNNQPAEDINDPGYFGEEPKRIEDLSVEELLNIPEKKPADNIDSPDLVKDQWSDINIAPVSAEKMAAEKTKALAEVNPKEELSSHYTNRQKTFNDVYEYNYDHPVSPGKVTPKNNTLPPVQKNMDPFDYRLIDERPDLQKPVETYNPREAMERTNVDYDTEYQQSLETFKNSEWKSQYVFSSTGPKEMTDKAKEIDDSYKDKNNDAEFVDWEFATHLLRDIQRIWTWVPVNSVRFNKYKRRYWFNDTDQVSRAIMLNRMIDDYWKNFWSLLTDWLYIFAWKKNLSWVKEAASIFDQWWYAYNLKKEIFWEWYDWPVRWPQNKWVLIYWLDWENQLVKHWLVTKKPNKRFWWDIYTFKTEIENWVEVVSQKFNSFVDNIVSKAKKLTEEVKWSDEYINFMKDRKWTQKMKNTIWKTAVATILRADAEKYWIKTLWDSLDKFKWWRRPWTIIYPRDWFELNAWMLPQWADPQPVLILKTDQPNMNRARDFMESNWWEKIEHEWAYKVFADQQWDFYKRSYKWEQIYKKRQYDNQRAMEKTDEWSITTCEL